MINISSIADLKNRTLVESNTLKSFILSSGISTDGFKTPVRDDILIHDYQMANSITINSILSNYIVNLKYAWDNYFNPRYFQTDSYFKIVGEGGVGALGDDTSMFMYVDEGAGSFYKRCIELDSQTTVPDDGTLRYINLDSVWYGVQEVVVTVDSGEKDDDGNPIRVPKLVDEKMITTNHLVIAPEPMNNFAVNPNPFGQNPFDAPFPDDPGTPGVDEFRGSFNQFMDVEAGEREESLTVNCVIENLFYANRFSYDTGDVLANMKLPGSRYIVCAAQGLYGLVPMYENKEFIGMGIYDIGEDIQNINHDKYSRHLYDFLWCGFASIGEEATLFIVFRDLNEGGGYHYVYLNANTYDSTYGFVKIRQLVNDTLIVDPDNVFSKVESIRELDNVTIALTDYGFWDVESNQTNNITYSYRGAKNHGDVVYNSYPKNDTKIVLPDNPDIGSGSIVVQYDKPWELSADGNYYSYGTSKFVKSLKIENEEHAFVGGVEYYDKEDEKWIENFAVYNSTANEHAYILAGVSVKEFRHLLYANSNLSGLFTQWLYDQVTDPLKGQKYIDGISVAVGNKCRDIGSSNTYTNIVYPLSLTNISLTSNLASIKSVLESRTANLTTLQRCCRNLYDLKSWQPSLSWMLTGGENGLITAIKNWFGDQTNPDGFVMKHRDVFIDKIIDVVVGEWPLLGYFRNHLKNYLNGVIVASGGNQEVTVDSNTRDAILRGVRDFIMSKVQAALVIGGYDTSKTGNEMYPNLNSYLYWDRVRLDRAEIQNVYSTLNARNEIVKALQSTPFFGTYLTWADTFEHVGDGNLFRVVENQYFARLSGYLTDSSNVDVNWDDIKAWLFTNASTNLSPESLLNALVKTQIYRPIFFKHDNYEKFTSDIAQYWCETQKSFVDHEGEPHQLMWVNGEFGVVDPVASGLGPAIEFEDGHVDQDSVKYLVQNNIVQYDVRSAPIMVRNDSFVYNDTQFYITWHNAAGLNGKVKSIYFNEFQKDIQNMANAVEIDEDGYFTIDLNFIDYNGNKVSLAEVNNESGNKYRFHVETQSDGTVAVVRVDSTEVFDGEAPVHKWNEYRQQVVDDLFSLEGIWFRLVKDETGYCGIEYAYVEDRLLVRELVSIDGTAQFKRWGLSFKFNYGENGQTSVVVVKQLSIAVSDHIVEEWCRFSGSSIHPETHEVGNDRTFEWNLSSEILNMREQYPIQMDGLGNGVLYDGFLNNATFRLCARNASQGGSVSTDLVLKIIGQEGTAEKELNIETLYDNVMRPVPGKLINGTMGSDGLFRELLGGSQTAVKRDINGPNNRTNLVWVESATWNTNNLVQDVGEIDYLGTVEGGSANGTVQLKFKSSYKDVPDLVQLTPVYSKTTSGENVVAQYVVRVVENGFDQKNTYNITDNIVNFLSKDGTRYFIDL